MPRKKERVKCRVADCSEWAVKLEKCNRHYTAEHREKLRTGEAVPRVDLGPERVRLTLFVKKAEFDYFAGRYAKGERSSVLRAEFLRHIREIGYEPHP